MENKQKIEYIREKCIEANPSKKWIDIVDYDNDERDEDLPPHLGDILLVYKNKFKGKEVNYFSTNEFHILMSRWNLLKDSLSEQSPETIDFIFNLLQ